MRIKVVKNVELDMDAPTATDDGLIDHKKGYEEENHYMPMLWRPLRP